jgi:hypothetical protein
MSANLLYNGQEFPDYIFTDKVKSYLFVDFDIIFTDEEFWQIMKVFLTNNNVSKIVVENLDPDYLFREEIDVAGLPKTFMKAVRTENLKGYFSCDANLHMITIKTLIYSGENGEIFCILLDRDYSIGIIGFSNPIKSEIFMEYEIKDVTDYLRLTFAGKDLPSDLKKTVVENWVVYPNI